MLVLSRQKDETIMIGDDVEITVVDIRGDKVRIGITAPPHIPVHRKEVYEAIKRENRAAANVKPEDIPSVSNSGRGGPTPPTTPGMPAPTNKGKAAGNGKTADSNNRSKKTNNSDSGSEGTQPAG